MTLKKWMCFLAGMPTVCNIVCVYKTPKLGASTVRPARWIPIPFDLFPTRNGSNLISPGMKSVKRMESGENAKRHAMSPDPEGIE